MTCPYLEYRANGEDHDFDYERPYCAAAESFVSPMKADVCNDRHQFDHAVDCDIFRRVTEDDALAPEPTD